MITQKGIVVSEKTLGAMRSMQAFGIRRCLDSRPESFLHQLQDEASWPTSQLIGKGCSSSSESGRVVHGRKNSGVVSFRTRVAFLSWRWPPGLQQPLSWRLMQIAEVQSPPLQDLRA